MAATNQTTNLGLPLFRGEDPTSWLTDFNGAMNILDNLGQVMLDKFYPVGSYYETSDTSFNPNTSFGGTWVEDTSGRVTVARNNNTFSTVGSTGGTETHTLTAAQLPSQTGRMQFRRTYDGTSYANIVETYPSGTSGVFKWSTNSGDNWGGRVGTSWHNQVNACDTITFDNGGQNQAHNNLQPYVVVKRWHRTA